MGHLTMKLLACIAIVALNVVSLPAMAEKAFSGNSWLVYCGKYPTGDVLVDSNCESYTTGAIEAWYMAKLSSSPKTGPSSSKFRPYCLAPEQTISQYISVIRQRTALFPEHLNGPAALIIGAAMRDAFPCKN